MDLYRHFGLRDDPFANAEPFESADYKAVRAAVARAVEDRGWLLVYGVPGAGKTFSTYEAVYAMENCRVVRTLSGHRKAFEGTNIDSAVMEDMTDEKPRQSREARRRQLERILGEATRDGEVCVMIDESTSMHQKLFTEIKFMRDSLRFGADPRNPRRMDRRPLFSVIMIGWPSLAARIEKSNELRPRIRRLEMQGMARSEVYKFIEHLGLSGVCPKEAAQEIADKVRFPLAIMDRLREGMERAWSRGSKTISREDMALDVCELYRLVKRTGVKLREIADATGKSIATVSTAVNGGAVSENTMQEIEKFLQARAADQRGESAARAG